MFDATSPHTLTALENSGSDFGRDEPNRECRKVSFQKSKKEDLANNATYRQFFAKRWQAFICENFTSAAHVAVHFGVTPVTAQNWIDGFNAPQGWVVGKAMVDPELSAKAIRHLGGAGPCERHSDT